MARGEAAAAHSSAGRERGGNRDAARSPGLGFQLRALGNCRQAGEETRQERRGCEAFSRNGDYFRDEDMIYPSEKMTLFEKGLAIRPRPGELKSRTNSPRIPRRLSGSSSPNRREPRRSVEGQISSGLDVKFHGHICCTWWNYASRSNKLEERRASLRAICHRRGFLQNLAQKPRF